MKEGTKYEEMICDLLEHGNSVRMTSAIVSSQMRHDGVPSFTSVSPVLSVIKRLNPIRNNFRKMNQQSNSHSAWVKARHNWCLHLLVRLGQYSDKVVANNLSALPSLPSWLDQDTLSSQGYMFDIYQVVHFDEVHVKQKYGHGAFQLRFKRNNGKVIKNEGDKYERNGNLNSGYGPERFNLSFKFEEEARFMLGVSMVQEKIDDCLVSRGVHCPLFNYTGKIIVGMGKWRKLVSQVLKDVKENGKNIGF